VSRKSGRLSRRPEAVIASVAKQTPRPEDYSQLEAASNESATYSNESATYSTSLRNAGFYFMEETAKTKAPTIWSGLYREPEPWPHG
jgi:hypothetical protein